MENKNLTEKESLEIISRMIQNTQNNLEKSSGVPFLIWGYITVIVTAIIGVGYTQIEDYRWNFLWFLIPIVGWVTNIVYNRRNESQVKTYIDTVINKLWLTISAVSIIVSMLTFIKSIPVLFIMLIIMGIGTITTGLIIKFKPITVGGIISVLLSIAQLYYSDSFYSVVIFASAFIFTMIIPGHILNHRARKNTKNA